MLVCRAILNKRFVWFVFVLLSNRNTERAIFAKYISKFNYIYTLFALYLHKL